MQPTDLAALDKAATQGPWEIDSERNEDCSPRHHDYFIGGPGPMGKWATLFDSVNSDMKLIEEEFDEDHSHAWDSVGKANAALIVYLRNNVPTILAQAERIAKLGEILSFDCTAFPGMEDAAVKWANKISGERGKPPMHPDPVMILDMCEDIARAALADTAQGDGM